MLTGSWIKTGNEVGSLLPTIFVVYFAQVMDETSVKASMQRAVDAIHREIASIRTGRATPSLVEDIMVAAYGGTQHLRVQELASITAPDTQMLLIEPWDKSIIGEIKQAILAANIGLSPAIDSEKIRISLPPLTTEDRERYVKLLKAKLEEGRVSVRQSRADAMHEIKKSLEDKQITEDDKFAQEKRVQELTDQFIAKIEEMGSKKEQELLSL
jgi:ribosome recycling factor